MHIERVDFSPKQEVYNPGDVLDLAVYFGTPFVGQCEVGLVKREDVANPGFARSVLARSSDKLYEGQVHVRLDHVGACVLLARLTPARGAPEIVPAGDEIFQVRQIRP